MSDDSTQDPPKSLDAMHKQWLRTAEDAVVREFKAHRPFVRDLVREYSQRVVVLPNGQARALDRNGQFYGIDDPEYPLAGLVSELGNLIPDEQRLEAVHEAERNIAQLREIKRASGLYTL